MKNIKIILTIFLTLLFLNACSSVVEGLSGSKKKGSEEFLVEKKAPLVLPPSFGELPIPKNQTNKNIVKNENRLSIEKMVDESFSVNSNSEKNDSNKSIEESIIKKINSKTIEENLNESTKEIKEKPKKKSFFKRLKEKFDKK
jgi:hypothetical protein